MNFDLVFFLSINDNFLSFLVTLHFFVLANFSDYPCDYPGKTEYIFSKAKMAADNQLNGSEVRKILIKYDPFFINHFL